MKIIAIKFGRFTFFLFSFLLDAWCMLEKILIANKI
jgi:hypothetical protein